MSKVMTMKEAVSKYVKSGDTLFISGAQHGEPSAAIHEIIRQRIRHLNLICALVTTSSFLIGEGCIDKLITGYSPQDPVRGYSMAKAIKNNTRPVYEESSHFAIALALLAGYMGVPFMPTKSLLGSDMLKYNENIGSMKCPFTDETVGVVKAVVPDTGIIHVQRADAEGNAQKWGSLGVDFEGINASKTIIVTTEKIVDSDVIRRDPNRTIIPGFRVSAVVEQPFGALPMHLAGCYDGDMFGHMMEMRDEAGYENYMEKFVYGVKDWNEYLRARKAFKGDDYFDNLNIKDPIYSEPVIHGY
ncbi:CoA transferase subunit A [Chloroflexota bacterium]